MDLVIGIDIGGTNTALGAVNREGHVVKETSLPTNADKKADILCRELFHVCSGWINENPDWHLKGIGVGAPNANFYTGWVSNPPNLKWGTVNLAGMLNDLFNLPVYITNDANASALGEMLFGSARGMKDFIVITLGTGLGSGVVVDGKLVYGHNGFAGELGHNCIDFHGRHCACGNRGCLETYVSATGIVRSAIELLGKRIHPSPLRSIPANDITAEMLYNLALENDPIAMEAFDYTAHLLGVSCANVAMLTAPEAYIITGGLARAESLFFQKTKQYMEHYLLENFRNQIQILPSGLQENPAILGAAALAWNEMKANGEDKD
ncbi:MAG: ROK family protein [Calditrichaeota bacterium]|nr:MAG: ROK family protein [Calditrichota bacterium]